MSGGVYGGGMYCIRCFLIDFASKLNMFTQILVSDNLCSCKPTLFWEWWGNTFVPAECYLARIDVLLFRQYCMFQLQCSYLRFKIFRWSRCFGVWHWVLLYKGWICWWRHAKSKYNLFYIVLKFWCSMTLNYDSHVSLVHRRFCFFVGGFSHKCWYFREHKERYGDGGVCRRSKNGEQILYRHRKPEGSTCWYGSEKFP